MVRMSVMLLPGLPSSISIHQNILFLDLSAYNLRGEHCRHKLYPDPHARLADVSREAGTLIGELDHWRWISRTKQMGMDRSE